MPNDKKQLSVKEMLSAMKIKAKARQNGPPQPRGVGGDEIMRSMNGPQAPCSEICVFPQQMSKYIQVKVIEVEESDIQSNINQLQASTATLSAHSKEQSAKLEEE